MFSYLSRCDSFKLSPRKHFLWLVNISLNRYLRQRAKITFSLNFLYFLISEWFLPRIHQLNFLNSKKWQANYWKIKCGCLHTNDMHKNICFRFQLSLFALEIDDWKTVRSPTPICLFQETFIPRKAFISGNLKKIVSCHSVLWISKQTEFSVNRVQFAL